MRHTEESHGRPAARRRVGRPAIGAAIVDKLACDEHVKAKLRLLVATLTQEMTVDEACAALHVSRARLHKLRDHWLSESASALEPRRPGRPPRIETAEDREIRRLAQENERLRHELRLAHERVGLGALRRQGPSLREMSARSGPDVSGKA